MSYHVTVDPPPFLVYTYSIYHMKWQLTLFGVNLHLLYFPTETIRGENFSSVES